MSDYFPKRLIQTLLICFISINVTYAITVTSVCDGNWSDSATWDLGVPSTADSVAIYHNVRLDVPVVLNLPASLYISVSGELCGYETLQCEFIADGPISAGSFIIEGNSVNNAPLQSAGSVTVNGSWTVNSSTCIGCSFTCPPILNPCSPPVADFTASNASICADDCLNFTDLSAGFPSSWQWSFPGAASSTSTAQNPGNICYPTAGTYDVTLVVTNINGSDSITKTVVVNPNPMPNFSNTTVCLNQATVYADASSISSGSITQWQWDFGDGAGTSTAQNPTYTYSSPGTFVVTLTIFSDSGCAAIVGYLAQVFPLPVAGFTTANVCLYDAAVFTDISTISSGSVTSWQWDFGDGNTSSATNPTHLYSADSTYNVTLIVTSNNNCTDTIVQPIEIYSIPVAGFSTNNVCLNDPAVFTDTSSISNGNIVLWNWDFGDGSPLNFSQNPTHSYSTDGTYNVSLIVITNNNCGDAVIQPLIIYPVPAANFTTDLVCLYDASVFTDASIINNPDNIVSWQWDFGDGLGTSTIQNPSYNYGSDGLYNAQLTVTSNNGCIDNTALTIEIYPIPVASFTSDTLIGCEPLCVNFSDLTTVIGGTISFWDWDFGDGNTSNNQNPTNCYTAIDANTSRIATVTLIVTSSNGCLDTLTFVDMISVCPSPVGISELPIMGNSINLYPNPYTGQTHIVFRLANKANVSLEVYNILGAKIHTLYDGTKDRGDYQYVFSAVELGHSSGIYLLRLMVNDKVYTRRLIEF